MLLQNYVKLEGKPAQQMVKLMDILEDHEDWKKVWSNADIEEKEIEALVGVRIFGIDPGSPQRTGYGCVERIGSRQTLVVCGSLGSPRATFRTS